MSALSWPPGGTAGGDLTMPMTLTRALTLDLSDKSPVLE